MIWRAVWREIQQDESIQSTDAAFVAVLAAKKYGVGKSKAQKLVSMIEKSQLELLGHNDSISRFLEKRRKRLK